MSDGVIVTVNLSVRPERLEELVDMLRAMFPVTRLRDGFRNIRLLKSEIEGNTILLLEEWDTAQDFHSYIAFRVETGEMAIISEMTDSPPQIGIWDRAALAEA
jgi:quinol monooxygenase YgiN